LTGTKPVSIRRFQFDPESGAPVLEHDGNRLDDQLVLIGLAIDNDLVFRLFRRPFKPAQAIRAVQITSRFPSVHGAPVHLGHPHSIGIKDITKPEYGDAVPIAAHEIPVFCACGVTPQAVIAAAKVPFVIMMRRAGL
jgi:hypothetical protein